MGDLTIELPVLLVVHLFVKNNRLKFILKMENEREIL